MKCKKSTFQDPNTAFLFLDAQITVNWSSNCDFFSFYWPQIPLLCIYVNNFDKIFAFYLLYFNNQFVFSKKVRFYFLQDYVYLRSTKLSDVAYAWKTFLFTRQMFLHRYCLPTNLRPNYLKRAHLRVEIQVLQ